jgi:hypothetical protein
MEGKNIIQEQEREVLQQQRMESDKGCIHAIASAVLFLQTKRNNKTWRPC